MRSYSIGSMLGMTPMEDCGAYEVVVAHHETVILRDDNRRSNVVFREVSLHVLPHCDRAMNCRILELNAGFTCLCWTRADVLGWMEENTPCWGWNFETASLNGFISVSVLLYFQQEADRLAYILRYGDASRGI